MRVILESQDDADRLRVATDVLIARAQSFKQCGLIGVAGELEAVAKVLDAALMVPLRQHVGLDRCPKCGTEVNADVPTCGYTHRPVDCPLRR